jgi:hypothetical protein
MPDASRVPAAMQDGSHIDTTVMLSFFHRSVHASINASPSCMLTYGHPSMFTAVLLPTGGQFAREASIADQGVNFPPPEIKHGGGAAISQMASELRLESRWWIFGGAITIRVRTLSRVYSCSTCCGNDLPVSVVCQKVEIRAENNYTDITV